MNIGIDLGTINTCIGIFINNDLNVLSIKDKKTIPSIVAIDKDKILVGRKALESKSIYKFPYTKRLLGVKYYEIKKYIKYYPYKIRKNKEGLCEIYYDDLKVFYKPDDIIFFILNKIKNYITKHFNIKNINCVISVPSYFNYNQRSLIKDIINKTNMNILKILNEPTSSALFYNIKNKSDDNVMIYDFGGGTLDVTIMRSRDNILNILATCGDNYLGGEDFNNRLYDYVILICFKHIYECLINKKINMNKFIKLLELNDDDIYNILIINLVDSDSIITEILKFRKEFNTILNDLKNKTKDLFLNKLGIDNILDILCIDIKQLKDLEIDFELQPPINDDLYKILEFRYKLDEFINTNIKSKKFINFINLKNIEILNYLENIYTRNKRFLEFKNIFIIIENLKNFFNNLDINYLKNLVEEIKIELSNKEEYKKNIMIEYNKNNYDIEIYINNTIFYDICKIEFDKSLLVIKEALKNSKLNPLEINKIVLVGGTTKIPKIRNDLKNIFKNSSFVENIDPDLTVAIGNLISSQDDINKNIILKDVITYSIGVEVNGGLMFNLIDRNSKYPYNTRKIVTTNYDYQDSVELKFFEGERGLVNYNRFLGKIILKDISLLSKGNPKIVIDFTINENGLINIETWEEGKNNKTYLIIERNKEILDTDTYTSFI